MGKISNISMYDILQDEKGTAKSIFEKSTVKQKQATAKRGSLIAKLELIDDSVENFLGRYRDKYQVIRDYDTLENYINDALLYGNEIAIDTETTGLDPIQDKIVGLCIYAEGVVKPAYIPINHTEYGTGDRIKNQLTEKEVAEQLQRLVKLEVPIIMHNGKFDIRVIRNQLGVYMTCYWDTLLASMLMNENEDHSLKKLHQKYVLDDSEEEFKFDEYFKGVTFDKVTIDSAYLYAAHDAIITYELYQFQKEWLSYDNEREDMRKLAKVFFEIEMPCVNAVADMEDAGILFDMNYAKELSEKYHKILEEEQKKFSDICAEHEEEINHFRQWHKDKKLDNPINISSPTQLAILLYDILKLKCPDKNNPRGTGEEILNQIDHPICKVIVDCKKTMKLLDAFIDSLPGFVNPKDGRVHCNFNQYGAKTGRFSCSDPNLQQIPAKNHDIRKLFKAPEGYVLMSSDFSAQEPRTLAAMCRLDGDSKMYDAYMANKDLYSEIASKAFNKPYEACLEFYPDGSTNESGKSLRSQAKRILLGTLYGRGVASIAEQLGTSKEKASAIRGSVFKAFPAIKKFENASIDMAYDLGYVTTITGRKRRLPDIFSGDPSKVARAERQCVNARIQGGAADISKKALIYLNQDKRLRELGFRVLIPIHDEFLCECPEKNKEECSKLLAELMSKASEDIIGIPMDCDVAIYKKWTGEDEDI